MLSCSDDARRSLIATRCQSPEASAETIQGDGDVNILMGIHTHSDHFGSCSWDRRSRHVLLPSVGGGRRALCAHQSRGEADTTAMGLLPKSTSFYKVTPISGRWWRCPRSGRRITSKALL